MAPFSRVKITWKNKREGILLSFCGLLFVPFFLQQFFWSLACAPSLFDMPGAKTGRSGWHKSGTALGNTISSFSLFKRCLHLHAILHKGNLHQWEVAGKKLCRATALVTSENILKICLKLSSFLIEMQSSLYIIIYFCNYRLISLMDIYSAFIWQ